MIAGPPNVGKSSLLNALLGYRRAIVFDQPGTTRDVVTSTTAIDGWPVELSDTAGLRSSDLRAYFSVRWPLDAGRASRNTSASAQIVLTARGRSFSRWADDGVFNEMGYIRVPRGPDTRHRLERSAKPPDT